MAPVTARDTLMIALAAELGPGWSVVERPYSGGYVGGYPTLTDGTISLDWGRCRSAGRLALRGVYPQDAYQLLGNNPHWELQATFATSRSPRAIAQQVLRALVPTVREITDTLNLYRHQRDTMLASRQAFVEKLVPFGAARDDGAATARGSKYEARFMVGNADARVVVNHNGNGGSLVIGNLTDMQILDALLAIEAGQTAAVVAALQQFPPQG